MTGLTDTRTPQSARSNQGGRRWKWLLSILAGFVVLAIGMIIWMVNQMNYVPEELNLSTELVSDQGYFRISYLPKTEQILVNQIHTWILHVETMDGQFVEEAQILVDGDMPQHGHGLPTVPQVTAYLGNGDYQVEGLKFHMPGWWIMEFEVTNGSVSDQVTFNLMLIK